MYRDTVFKVPGWFLSSPYEKEYLISENKEFDAGWTVTYLDDAATEKFDGEQAVVEGNVCINSESKWVLYHSYIVEAGEK